MSEEKPVLDQRPLLHCSVFGPFLLCVTVMSLAAVIAWAQSIVEPPAPRSPHWAHINVFDFGRALYLGVPSASDVEWMASHLDLVEAHGNVPQVRTLNPTIKVSSYQLDMSILQSRAVALTDESWFLHHSEDTTLEFRSLGDHSIIKSVTIPGCPKTPVFACRVQVYLWSDLRYIYNLNTATLRVWLKDRLLSSANAYGMDVGTNDYIWLDEHAPGFQWPFSYNFQTIIKSGGAILELNNLNPSAHIAEIGSLYNGMVVNWLNYLAPFAAAAGKKVLINANAQVLFPDIDPQINAIHGFDTESFFRPDGISSPSQFWSLATRVSKTVAAGGCISLHGIWGNPIPVGYTAGNYSSAAARNLMWRLIGYYAVKEPVDSPGIVYFNPAFNSNNSMHIADDIAAWLPAYQVNVGQPSGSLMTYQAGAVEGQTYTIYGRTYSKGVALVRPKDCTNCTNFSDTSAAPVLFSTPVQVLKDDGTLSALTSSVNIRNAEAVFVFTNQDTVRQPLGKHPLADSPLFVGQH